MNTLLITWTIKPSNWIHLLKIFNPDERYLQYMNTILNYIINSNFDIFIFCENSNYNITDKILLQRIAELNNKKIEILQFNWNEKKVVEKWRWYWESEIIEYAIKNSEFLKNANTFFKVTWRYLVKNINEILISSASTENIFFKTGIRNHMCNTSFFKTNKTFFEENLIWAWEEVNDFAWKDYYLESIYYKRLRTKSSEIWKVSPYPIFSWIWWSWGRLDLPRFTIYTTKILNLLWFYLIK